MKTGTKIGWALVAVAIFISVWVLTGGVGRAGSETDANGNIYEIADDGTLTSVTINSSVVDIPGSVTKIGDSVFANQTGITEIKIPCGVTGFGSGAFMNCTSLSSIDFKGDPPVMLQSIGDSAFANCSKIASITIPDSVTYIAGDAFSGCSELANINISGNSCYAKDEYGVVYTVNGQELLICPPKAMIGEYTIKSTCQTVNPGAFSGNHNIQILHIPASVTTWNDQGDFSPAHVYFASSIGESVETAIRASFNNGVTLTEPEGSSPSGTYAIGTIYEDTATGEIVIPFSGPDVSGGSVNGFAIDATNATKNTSSATTVIRLKKDWVNQYLRPASGSVTLPVVLSYNSVDYNGSFSLSANPTPPPAPTGYTITPASASIYNTEGPYNMVTSAARDKIQSVVLKYPDNTTRDVTSLCTYTDVTGGTQISFPKNYVTGLNPGYTYKFVVSFKDVATTVESALTIKTPGGGGGGGGTSGGGSTTGGGTITGGGTVSNLYGNGTVTSSTGTVTSGTTTASQTTGTTHTKDATPTTADGWDARLAFAIAILLAGVVVLMLSRRNAAKLETIKKDRN